jgi:hypothetical protein
MASWIVHLRIAENLLAEIPSLDESLFAVGNIAPDSGIPDEKWENFNPPPLVSHFQDSTDVHRNCRDLDLYRQYLAPLHSKTAPREFSFLLGYFFHLITDNLWSIRIGRPTHERFDREFAHDKDFIWEVKKDWYGLDFIYLREHPHSLFQRVFLQAGYDGPDYDFMPAEAIRQRVAYIGQYYQRSDDETLAMTERPFIYLTKSAMDDFVRDASDRMSAIYRYLWVGGGETDNHGTALAIGV